ncbi:hypothetical protein HYC85_022362 [Camellia sinensis]|uniref:Uncharacterized protein n=1 Tax=Camellia sinensis TaxID=4442 RepID=A0A7J7GLX4_CAMSI|nr:hypothetical protein HYC85_022362 [Camellia sinensis]
MGLANRIHSLPRSVVCPSSLSSSDLRSSDSVEHLLMDNNYATKKGRKELIEEFVALQHVVSSINYACAMYIVILHAAFKKKDFACYIQEDANATTVEGEQSPVEQFSMNMGDTDYSMSTAGNVPNRADSTKTGKKRTRHAEGIPTELSEMAKNLRSFIENTNTTMVEIAYRIGYSHDLSQQRRLVNAELLKLPISNTQRLMAASMIVKDEDKVDLFFSLDENDKMEWVSLLLEGHI